jgi:hypothetical protein
MTHRLDGALCVGQPWLFEATDPISHWNARRICFGLDDGPVCPALDACHAEALAMVEAAAATPDGFRPVGTWAGQLYKERAQRPSRAAIVDEGVVLRIMAGEYRVRANRSERREVVERWRAAGRSLKLLARETGWKVERYTPEGAPSQCGTLAGYMRHVGGKETACDECRAAKREHSRQRRARDRASA